MVSTAGTPGRGSRDVAGLPIILITMIRLFVGLGNPGPEYEATRHNAGFWWVDALAAKLGARLASDRSYHGHVARVNTADGPVWLLQPMTFMNRSGQSVAALARFFKIAPDQILVVHDELDVPPGQAKLKFGGSSGGHNGLKDIQAQLGTPNYWRLRLGIGHPGVKAEVVDYVLRKPAPDHRDAIEACISRTLEASALLLAGDMARATMKIHAGPQRPKPPRPAAAAAASAKPGAGAAGLASPAGLPAVSTAESPVPGKP